MFGMVILVVALLAVIAGIILAILVGLFIWQAVREWKGKRDD